MIPEKWYSKRKGTKPFDFLLKYGNKGGLNEVERNVYLINEKAKYLNKMVHVKKEHGANVTNLEINTVKYWMLI